MTITLHHLFLCCLVGCHSSVIIFLQSSGVSVYRQMPGFSFHEVQISALLPFSAQIHNFYIPVSKIIKYQKYFFLEYIINQIILSMSIPKSLWVIFADKYSKVQYLFSTLSNNSEYLPVIAI